MSWKNKRVLVTGINGFVGGYLADFLVREGAVVYGLIRRRAEGGTPENIRYHRLDGLVTLVEGDILDLTTLASALDVSQPEVIFHLAAQTYVPRSFQHPTDTYGTNILGTLNLLEAMRLKRLLATVVWAGSSEEYGLVFASNEQYQKAKQRYSGLFPEPRQIPELPIREDNPLRPMSPYAVSKVSCDFMMRNYYHAYGMKTIVSRAFNHEGAGRGSMFVTSVVANQVARLMLQKGDKILIGDVNAFRDWSHVRDIVKGYALLAERGIPGEVYNQGSQRTNSVLTYILLALQEAGYQIEKIETMKRGKVVREPLQMDNDGAWGMPFEKSKVDGTLLNGELSFDLEDVGIRISTDKGEVPVYFDPSRFRPAEVPILLSDISKFGKVGFSIQHSLKDIVRDQLNYALGGH